MGDENSKIRLEDMKFAREFFKKNGAIPLTLVIMGCMAQRLLDDLKDQYPVVDYVVGTFGKYKFGEIIQAVENGNKPFKIKDEETYTFAVLNVRADYARLQQFLHLLYRAVCARARNQPPS